jgi:hypothetical protein
MQSEKYFNYKTLKIIILSLILIISFWRSPYIFLNGRFIDEEARKHLIYALQNPFLKNLFYYDSFAGYFNLLPNILLWAATKVRIEFAPLMTVYGSFFFIILLPYLCLFRESKFLDKENKKILASLILFLSPPFVPEIWINSLNSQIYFCLISILILFMINLNQKEKIINQALLLLSGLSGVYTCALFPLFGFKFLLERSRYNFINATILFITSTIQFTLILYSKLSNSLHGSVLSNDFTFDIIPIFFYNIIAKSFFGREFTQLLWDNIFIVINHSYLVFFSLVTIALITLVLLRHKMISSFFRKNEVLLNLIAIFSIISLIILFGSVSNQVGGRYAVIPGSVLILCALECFYKTKNLYLKYFSIILIMLSLTAGIDQFRPYQKNIFENQYIKFLDCINCPDWKSEISIWKNDKNYIIGIWPYPSKDLILPNLSNIKIN